MIGWSVLAALLGTLGSRLALARVHRLGGSPHLYWFVGLLGMLPAWLIAFVGLLGASATARPEAVRAAAFIWSSATGLLGLILSEAAVRRLHESGRPYGSLTYWGVGGAALIPAWATALLGLAWTPP